MADIQAFGSNPAPVEGVGGWLLGQHRGPLTVTDDFSVLDDPVEQQDEVDNNFFYELFEQISSIFSSPHKDGK